MTEPSSGITADSDRPLAGLRSGFDDPEASPISPCKVFWDSMKGDDRIRQCGTCGLGVYNVTGLSFEEAQGFVSRTEGLPCKRLYQRPDGTVLARDCPVRLDQAVTRVSLLAGALAAAVFTVVFFARLPASHLTSRASPPVPQRLESYRLNFGLETGGQHRRRHEKRHRKPRNRAILVAPRAGLAVR